MYVQYVCMTAWSDLGSESIDGHVAVDFLPDEVRHVFVGFYFVPDIPRRHRVDGGVQYRGVLRDMDHTYNIHTYIHTYIHTCNIYRSHAFVEIMYVCNNAFINGGFYIAK
jgi:hypothetical protein